MRHSSFATTLQSILWNAVSFLTHSLQVHSNENVSHRHIWACCLAQTDPRQPLPVVHIGFGYIRQPFVLDCQSAHVKHHEWLSLIYSTSHARHARNIASRPHHHPRFSPYKLSVCSFCLIACLPRKSALFVYKRFLPFIGFPRYHRITIFILGLPEALFIAFDMARTSVRNTRSGAPSSVKARVKGFCFR